MINKSDRKNCTLFFSNCQNEIEDGIMCVSNEQCHMRVKQKMAARRHLFVLFSCDRANAYMQNEEDYHEVPYNK